MEIYAQNVNGAFRKALWQLLDFEERDGFWHKQSSRNGDTFEFSEPVATYYHRPQERVLFYPGRDANPFLHLFESLWLLAGRQDVRFMETLVKRFRDYSDGNEVMQGSYGYRWRKRFSLDQLEFLVKHLKAKPDSRRAVLTMWSPVYDMLGLDFGTHVEAGIDSKDIPCNTHAYFKVRDGRLNMTVCNRSNDLVWGAYGANAVHFSILQEYMAAKLGVEVGTYIQWSDSLHVYTGGAGGEVWERIKKEWCWEQHSANYEDPYRTDEVEARPMFGGGHMADWEEDLRQFFKTFDMKHGAALLDATQFTHPWWRGTAAPMWNAWVTRDPMLAAHVDASDWRKAALAWVKDHPKKDSKEVMP